MLSVYIHRVQEKNVFIVSTNKSEGAKEARAVVAVRVNGDHSKQQKRRPTWRRQLATNAQD